MERLVSKNGTSIPVVFWVRRIIIIKDFWMFTSHLYHSNWYALFIISNVCRERRSRRRERC